MIKFQDPWQFVLNRDILNNKVSYKNLRELSQGGPEVGDLTINGVVIEGYKFGGPLLNNGKYIFVPIYVKSFFSSGFKICKLNIESLELKIISKKEGLVNLDKIEDSKLYYYTDRNKINLKWLCL